MYMRIRKYLLVTLLSFFLLGAYTTYVKADNTTPTPTPTVTPTPGSNSSDTSADQQALRDRIKDLEGKISDLQGTEKTLSSEIAVMDNQEKLTQLRIASTRNELAELDKNIQVASTRINKLEGSLTGVTRVLINRIRASYMAGDTQSFQVLLTAKDAADFLHKEQYLKLMTEHDNQLLYQTEQAKRDYANQKEIFQDQQDKIKTLQAQLEDYTKQLDAEQQNKKNLLAQTQGSEDNYQRLLAQAKAQLAGFSRFTESQGGASLLSGQTSCDDWGCYYNQRDSQWGGNSLNGTQYSLASDGCLITSMAMVYTHYGHRNVTPQSINGSSSNFASYYPAFLNKSISADGASSQRVSADLDATLASGNPVIVGISYDGGPLADHFVVFVSGSGGDYTMKDPFTPNGNNIKFRDRYPSSRIVETEKVVF